MNKQTALTKVLNVLDGQGNVKALSSGFYESGYWHKPDLGCLLIRVFHKRGGPSIAGGRIVSSYKTADGLTVFVFENDAREQGRPRPNRFRPNGCVATFE